MLQPHQIEELLCVVATMQRATLLEKFQSFRGAFPVDFTPEFLDTLSTERLRHIFVALCIQTSHLPAESISTAA